MNRPRLRLGGLLAGLLLLTACGAPAASPHVAFDTPALRAAKAAAHVADCPVPTSAASAGGLPNVVLPCLGGGPGVPLAKLRGPMVINLWAQTCGPCRTEMPLLQAFSQKYAGKVAVLGVDYVDFQPDLALGLARATGVTYPLVADLAPAIRTSALPTTILIDAQGRIVYQRPVVFESQASLEKVVADKLGVAS